MVPVTSVSTVVVVVRSSDAKIAKSVRCVHKQQIMFVFDGTTSMLHPFESQADKVVLQYIYVYLPSVHTHHSVAISSSSTKSTTEKMKDKEGKMRKRRRSPRSVERSMERTRDER